MQLKAIMKKIAKEKRISAQLVLQNYMLERFLERVSLSVYRHNFVIKGGFLIASVIGLDSRATMDMDVTIRGYPVSKESIVKMIKEIITIPVDDQISFRFLSIGDIREDDEYIGFRVALSADYEKMAVPLKLDITTGDVITPGEIEFDYKLLLDNRSISVYAYNIVTVLAEKLETVISRGDQNTRPRDYYDIYAINKFKADDIDLGMLRDALKHTSQRRGSNELIKQYKVIMQAVRKSEAMNNQWNNYRRQFDYASDIVFDKTCDAVIEIMDKIIENTK